MRTYILLAALAIVIVLLVFAPVGTAIDQALARAAQALAPQIETGHR